VSAGVAPADATIEPCVPTNNPDHGDYQSNAAFRFAKMARLNPREVAERVLQALPDDPAIAEASLAGPGFLNLRLSTEWLGQDVAERARDPKLGTPNAGAGRTVVIDYSSPNIAKRMHVGHLRSTVIGYALAQLHRALGWNVVTDNHIGDWGTQFGKLIVMWRRDADASAYEADAIGELQRLYQSFGTVAESDPTLIDQARAETAKLQAGDPENLELWRGFVDASMEEFNRLYERLGVSFDVVHGESFYRDELQDLVEELLAKGIACNSDGAVIVPFTAEDGKGLANQPLLIRKSDGAALYGTTDLATARHRVQTWNPDRVLYVTDTRQQQHFRQVIAANKKMGLTGPDYVHAWFGMLKIGGAIASTREGGVINLVDLLDTAAAKAFDIVTEKNPDMPEAQRRDIAEAVGTAAIRYFDLSQAPTSDITFTWDKALSLDSGSAVYLMYAYARLASILRRAGADVVLDGPAACTHPSERTLAMLVARTPEAVLTAADAYRPNLLAEHLDAIAKAVGVFWNDCPVLADSVDATTRQQRLVLVNAANKALGFGLDLLGIRAIDTM
jgi:arginyl-tRNA synthetase